MKEQNFMSETQPLYKNIGREKREMKHLQQTMQSFIHILIL